MTLEDDAAQVLTERGPLTGAALVEATGRPVFAVWKACRGSGSFDLRVVGRRYVRMDRHVENFARLSPSILREFLTYTVVGLPGDADTTDRAAKELEVRIRAISRDKRRTAQRVADEVTEPLLPRGGDDDDAPFCILAAGDIVYDMAHDVPRQEVSTGAVVRGSDLDLVVLVADDAPPALVERLDDAILRRKWWYLRHPVYHEEVDYVVKPFARLREQAAFDTFAHMVACKVFDEARFLRGSASLHRAGTTLLQEAGVIDRLRSLEREALLSRDREEEELLRVEGNDVPRAGLRRWYTEDEAAEFEH